MTDRSPTPAILPAVLCAAASFALLSVPARADVTVGQKTSMNVAGVNIDIDSVERTSGDKQREDTTTRCHGLLALFCHDLESGRIVRLDRQLEWQLAPKKELYSERPFPTPEQRAEAQKKVAAALEQMKSCPMPQTQSASPSAPDTSHCQLSAPQISVTRTGEHATILGHDARKTSVVLSQTCTDVQTGDVCEIDYGFESWLTTDRIPGAGQRKAFESRYLKAQGLDPNSPQIRHTLQRFMAPYAEALGKLKGKAADLKGYPLRTTFYMAFGGPHCHRAKQAEQQQASRSSSRISVGSIASKAIAGGFASLFHRGAAAIHADSAAGAAASGAANEAAEPAAGAAATAVTQSPAGGTTAGPSTAAASGPLVRVMSLTTETTSIDTSSIPSDEFEIPAGWKLEPRKPAATRRPTCPTAGGRAAP